MKSILSILLAGILTASNLMPSVSTHFCMGRAVETVFALGHAHSDGCGMEESDEDCDSSESEKLSPATCCSDSNYTVQGTDGFSINKVSLALGDSFFAVPISGSTALSPFYLVTSQFFDDYSPPLLSKSFLVTLQVFRL